MAFNNAVADNSKTLYKLGKGKVYFARDGQGYIYLGNAPSLTVSGESDTLEHFSSTSGVAQKDDEVVLSQNRTASCTVDTISIDNMALFLGGSASTHTQANTAVTDEEITVQKGQYFQLGETTANPGGVRNVSAVVIQDDTDTTTYAEGTDYELDPDLGIIYILASGSIANNDVLHVDYTPASETRDRAVSGSTLSVDGKLKFVADNPKGANHDFIFPDVVVQPQGEMQLIGDEWQQIELAISINVPETGAQAVNVDGRAA